MIALYRHIDMTTHTFYEDVHYAYDLILKSQHIKRADIRLNISASKMDYICKNWADNQIEKLERPTSIWGYKNLSLYKDIPVRNSAVWTIVDEMKRTMTIKILGDTIRMQLYDMPYCTQFVCVSGVNA